MHTERQLYFVKKEVAPYHAEWEIQGTVSREVWLKAGQQGFLCMDFPMVEYQTPLKLSGRTDLASSMMSLKIKPS